MLAFPGGGGGLEAGELLDDRGHAARPVELVRGIDVLPAGQEVQELRGGDGLDLLAQPVERVAVDAGQQPAVAPGLRPVDARAQDDALRLEVQRAAGRR